MFNYPSHDSSIIFIRFFFADCRCDNFPRILSRSLIVAISFTFLSSFPFIIFRNITIFSISLFFSSAFFVKFIFLSIPLVDEAISFCLQSCFFYFLFPQISFFCNFLVYFLLLFSFITFSLDSCHYSFTLSPLSFYSLSYFFSFLRVSLFTYFCTCFSFSRWLYIPYVFFFLKARSFPRCCSRLAHCFAISASYSIAKQKADNAVAAIAATAASTSGPAAIYPSYLRPDATRPPTFPKFLRKFLRMNTRNWDYFMKGPIIFFSFFF